MSPTPLPGTRADWHRRIWALSWPNILANLTVPLVGLVDTAVMGHLPDAAYIGAVAIGAALFSATYWLVGFLRMGTTGLVAQRFGAGDLPGAALTGARAAVMAAVLGIAIIALQWPLGLAMAHAFDAGEPTVGLARRYLAIRIWGAPGMLMQFVALGVLFALQRMRRGLLLAVGVNVCNIVLDLWLVVGLDFGVGGVALGTAISEWLGAVFGAWLVAGAFRNLGLARLDRTGFWRGAGFARLFNVGGHLIIRSLFVQLPFFLVPVIGARLGAITLAANAVLMQYYMVVSFALDGFAHCAETLSGYAFGARDAAGLRSTLRFSLQWAALTAIAIATLYGVAGESMIALVTSQAPVRAEAGRYMPWVAAGPLVTVWAFLMDGIYIGTTQVRALRNHMLAAACVFVAACALFIPMLGNHGLWLAMTLFMLSRGATLLHAYPRIERLASA